MRKLFGLFCMLLVLTFSSAAFAATYHFGVDNDGLDFGLQLGTSATELGYSDILALTGSYDFALIGGSNSTVTKFHYGDAVITNEGFNTSWEGHKTVLGNLTLAELSFENASKKTGFTDEDSYIYNQPTTNTIKAWLLTEDFNFMGATLQAGWIIFGYEFGYDSDWNDMLVVVQTTPTPIPGAVLLLGSGLSGLAALRRRMA